MKRTHIVLSLALLCCLLTGCAAAPSAESVTPPAESAPDLQNVLTVQPSIEPEQTASPDPEPDPPTAPLPPELDCSGFVLLSDAVPDAILEIRYYSTYNFVGERIDGYEAPVALLTSQAAAALREVSDELLEQGYRLKIYDAYRPQTAVDHFQRWATDLEDTAMKEYFYPGLDKSVLFAQGYISARSGHSRGPRWT